MNMSNEHEVFDNQELLIQQQFFNTVSYLPFKELHDIRDGATRSEILVYTQTHINTLEEGASKEETKRNLEDLQSMIEHYPELNLGKAIIDDMSWGDNNSDGKADHPIEGMQACTFTTADIS